MSKRKAEPLFWGTILVVIGVLFMLNNMGIDIDIWEIIGDFWPMILIAIGVKNLWLHYQNKKKTE